MQLASVPEIAVYVLVILYLHGVVFLHGEKFSFHASNSVHLPGLAPGYLFGGRHVDLSDDQWRNFRAGLPLLAAAMGIFLGGSHVVRRLAPSPSARNAYYVAAGLAHLSVCHGWCAMHMVGLLLLHYAAARALAGRKYGLPVFWALACCLFLAIRASNGRLGLALLDSLPAGRLRWHISYNLTLLRVLSFASDLHWARTAKAEEGGGGTGSTTGQPGTARAAAIHLPLHEYSLANYLAYTLYPPLYIAGPIATFNAFAAQISKPVPPALKQVALYAARWAFALLCLEALTHTLYFNSIARHRAWGALERAGLTLTPLAYAGGSYWIIVFMWLKFTVIWRFFRLVALADGMDVPENMTRCVCNNYTVQGFWRSWHASYNQWLVRYLYIPLGGARWRALNVWAIFTFVALWHDLEWRLLSWAWIMAALVMHEAACARFARSRWARARGGGAAWRHACAVSGALNVTVLMTGNLVGFVVGPEGIVPLWRKLLASPGFLVATLATLTCAVQLMLALRAWEERRAGDAIRALSAAVDDLRGLDAIVFVTGGDGCGHTNDVFSGCFADDAEEARRRAAGVSMPVRLATNIVRFMHDNTGNWDGPAGGGVVSASFINAKPAVGGIGVEPRGGGVLRVLFTVASGAVADTVVRWRWKLPVPQRQTQVAVFDVLSDREEARHRALWPAFLAAKAAGKRAQFHHARLVVTASGVFRGEDTAAGGSTACACCGTSATPLWWKNSEVTICNACFMSTHGSGRSAPLLGRSLGAPPASVRSSRFIGVKWNQSSSAWDVKLWDGRLSRSQYLGCYYSEEDAARAYDAAVVQARGPGSERNFPVQAVSKTPAAVGEEEQKEPRSSSSRYVGVSKKNRSNSAWAVNLSDPRTARRPRQIGTYTSEEEAARAYDCAAVQAFGPGYERNFMRKLPVAVGDEQTQRKWSRYLGVS
ncbi:hypothetical protein FOA52_008142 [Chlamydomonas sp. UWO 241]|nr:hypothetical protein FOA52_008142 [Chlamydomonas sp. UWO 241]